MQLFDNLLECKGAILLVPLAVNMSKPLTDRISFCTSVKLAVLPAVKFMGGVLLACNHNRSVHQM